MWAALSRSTCFTASESVILTSATLTTDGQFDFLRERLNAWEADELTVGSPFDYKNSTLLYLPMDIPEPNQPHYQKMVDEALVELCRAAQGRTLVLFTSYYQLRNSARAISRVLVTKASPSWSRARHLAGTAPGELSHPGKVGAHGHPQLLGGHRRRRAGTERAGPHPLPFSVPDDPVFAARSETFDDPFGEYAIPETILRFRQGFGRLIRTKTDRGVVVILDKRVLTKSYGPVMFLNSLPDCTQSEARAACCILWVTMTMV
jgi:ATP-dependent DNA helicase DinG